MSALVDAPFCVYIRQKVVFKNEVTQEVFWTNKPKAPDPIPLQGAAVVSADKYADSPPALTLFFNYSTNAYHGYPSNYSTMPIIVRRL